MDSHYTKRAIEPWDYIAANNLDFFDGNVVKYITRWRDKGGVKDLDKIIVYINKIKKLNGLDSD